MDDLLPDTIETIHRDCDPPSTPLLVTAVDSGALATTSPSPPSPK